MSQCWIFNNVCTFQVSGNFFCKYHRLPSHYNGAIDVNNMSTFVELKTNKNCMFKNSSMSAFCNSQKVRFSFQQSYEINNGKKHGSEI